MSNTPTAKDSQLDYSDQALLEQDKLVSLMSSELDINNQIYLKLEQELQVLQQNSTHKLQALSNDKQQLLGQLKDVAKQRIEQMKRIELPDKPCPDDWQSFAAANKATQLWQSLGEQYAKNQKISEHLIVLTNKLRHRTKQKLEILRGSQAQTQLYTSQGQASRSSGSLNKVSV